MQLTRFSDVSLRLLLYLASRTGPADVLLTARAAATTFNVPYTHMVKVVHRLGMMGFLVTVRGKGGGLRLSRTAETIRVGEVLRATEPVAPIINCWEPECPLRFDCKLKHALDGAHEAFFRELDRYTLADMADMPALQQLVSMSGIAQHGRVPA